MPKSETILANSSELCNFFDILRDVDLLRSLGNYVLRIHNSSLFTFLHTVWHLSSAYLPLLYFNI